MTFIIKLRFCNRLTTSLTLESSARMADRLSLLAEYHKVVVKDAMYLDGGRSYKEKELNQEISQRFLLGTEGFTY